MTLGAKIEALAERIDELEEVIVELLEIIHSGTGAIVVDQEGRIRKRIMIDR